LGDAIEKLGKMVAKKRTLERPCLRQPPDILFPSVEYLLAVGAQKLCKLDVHCPPGKVAARTPLLPPRASDQASGRNCNELMLRSGGLCVPRLAGSGLLAF